MSDEKQAISSAEAHPKKPYQRKKCEHGKYPYYCALCGGAGICEHRKIRSGCKLCKGSSYCIHDRVKQYCEECGAKSICEHGQRRSRCRVCGTGGSLCEHKKLRSRCRVCDGRELCDHSRRREYCVLCKGSQTCEHGLRRIRCDECGGADRCPHKRDKRWCIQCAGDRVCSHGRIRVQCVPCGGVRTCSHGKRKGICKNCSPEYLCAHEKQKKQCVLCNPKIACQHCKYINIRQSRWKPHCFRCHCVLHPDDPIPRRFRLKEHYVVDALRAHFQDTLTMRCDKAVDGGCTRYRPDILIDFGSHIVIIEVDEFRHTNYVCEQKRMVDLYEDMGYRNTVFIRFNPDGYQEDGVRHPTPFPLLDNGEMAMDEEEMSDRMYELIQTILFYKDHVPDEPITYSYLFYGDQLLEGDEAEEKEAEEEEKGEDATTGI